MSAECDFASALDAAVAQRRDHNGEEHEWSRSLPDELRALALAERFTERWPGGVRLCADWRADTVSLCRAGIVTPLPSYDGDGVLAIGPFAEVATVKCWTDEGLLHWMHHPDLVERYGDWIREPWTATHLRVRAALLDDELAALVDVLGPWADEEVRDQVAHAEASRWERVGGPEPCLDPFATRTARSRFSGRVCLTPLHPNRFWWAETEHGPDGYVRFWPASEGGLPQWAWHLKGSTGWSRGTTGCFRFFDEGEVGKVARKDRLVCDAIALADLRSGLAQPALPAPPPVHLDGFVQVGLFGMAV